MASAGRGPILAVLEQADARLAGWSCDRSTDCCRPAVSGREPSVTEAEWRVLVAEVARQGRRLPPPATDGACAFLRDDRCTVYPARPLGCRTFYCERGQGPGGRLPRAELAALPRALEALSDPAVAEGRGRPLSTWLRLANKRGGR